MDSALPSPFFLESQAEGDALLLAARLGAPVTLRPLQDQRGTAAVIYTGQLVGKSVVTEHRVFEGGREQVYLVIYGNLASVATRAGVELKAETKLGTVGSSTSGHAVGLHLEVRRVRHAVDPRQLAPEQFRERAQTVACDARNVFPLKTPRGTLK
jgi:murein DD-endopeptidase MepM/ murein hydrolase activator NlpD